MTGVIFSDLGLASSFMMLDWVQSALKQSLGFEPFPATLNLRPRGAADAEAWRRARSETSGLALTPQARGYCKARLYRVEISAEKNSGERKIQGAILLPDVQGYPSDKIEIVAPMRLKDHFAVQDGDALTLEFH
jgi:CTP-dependent riboflavin kinase